MVLVFDKSGSMQGPPLEEAKRGARSFIERLQPSDEVTLLFFDSQVYPPFGPVKVGEKKAELLERIDGTFAQGGTRCTRPSPPPTPRSSPGRRAPRGGRTPWW